MHYILILQYDYAHLQADSALKSTEISALKAKNVELEATTEDLKNKDSAANEKISTLESVVETLRSSFLLESRKRRQAEDGAYGGGFKRADSGYGGGYGYGGTTVAPG